MLYGADSAPILLHSLPDETDSGVARFPVFCPSAPHLAILLLPYEIDSADFLLIVLQCDYVYFAI